MALGVDEIWPESSSNLKVNNDNNNNISRRGVVKSTKKYQSKSNLRPDGNNNNNNVVAVATTKGGVGSRRIFSPLFKLQVLDSYRQDSDCQGNQRATARKYGIHRRQIQKWLQMETSLRTSVAQQSSLVIANSNANTNVSNALNLTASENKFPDKNTTNVKSSSSINGTQFASSSSSMSTSSDFNYNRSPSLQLIRVSSTCSSSSSFKENNCTSDCEEYINVDEITDTEDEDSWSSASSNSNSTSEKALDFTRATLSKRRFYTTDFKLYVLDAFKNDENCKGNQRATARKFGIHRRQVQKWLNRENLIRSEHFISAGNLCLDLSRQSTTTANNNNNNSNSSSNNNNNKRKLFKLEVDSENLNAVSKFDFQQQSNNSNNNNNNKRKLFKLEVGSENLDVVERSKFDFKQQSDDLLALETVTNIPVQESALCLVKEKSKQNNNYNNNNNNSNNNNLIHRGAFHPQTEIRTLDNNHPYTAMGFATSPSSSSSINFHPHHPTVYCFCQTPWTYCYQHLCSNNNGGIVPPPVANSCNNNGDSTFIETTSSSLVYPKYYTLLDLKFYPEKSPSYVDIPLQYGFGDSSKSSSALTNSSKWLNESVATAPLFRLHNGQQSPTANGGLLSYNR